ncbi:hypothetical protein [Cellulomonas citrea]|uniref:hypothetical protein n=1 Tax=Cellulomonas citrea TaxID=1909423 RepID=UPI0013593F2E|nr:hypothetical protein [Cellulomonas citrea]
MLTLEWDAAWSEALTELEIDVTTAERMLDNDHLPSVDEVARLVAWRPPADLGPLPAALADRARALLDRQLATAAAMGRALVMNRRQLAAVAALAPTPAARPVFLDIEG